VGVDFSLLRGKPLLGRLGSQRRSGPIGFCWAHLKGSDRSDSENRLQVLHRYAVQSIPGLEIRD
jgi:hypothetical protein